MQRAPYSAIVPGKAGCEVSGGSVYEEMEGGDGNSRWGNAGVSRLARGLVFPRRLSLMASVDHKIEMTDLML